MLDRFVFRRDDEDFYPDDTKAPIRAAGTTSWGATFCVAFVLAEPPLVSRLYAHLPDFPDPRKQEPVRILASHRHLFLLRVGIESPGLGLVQDLFVYSASDTDRLYSLKAFPHCTLPAMDYNSRDGRLPRRRLGKKEQRRVLTVQSLGILCSDDDEREFVLAELKVFRFNRLEIYADIYWLNSSTSAAAGLNLSGEWNCKRVPISSSAIVGDENKYKASDDAGQLSCWTTHTVIPFGRWLCWVDYCRGILLCDVFGKPNPTVSFLRFPLDKFPTTKNRACSWLYRGASAIDDAGRALIKFVDVARDDDIEDDDIGFTITCHTLTLTAGLVSKDWVVTSAELWSANLPHLLPRKILMFPQVNIERPHVVCFLVSDSEDRYVMKKMWLVAIDMNTKTVESLSQYTNGLEDSDTENAEFTRIKSDCPNSFLPCDFPKFFHISSRRKDVE